MERRWKVAGAIGAVALVAGGAWWWKSTRRDQDASAGPRDAAGRAAGAQRSGPHAAGVAHRWLGQPGAELRRVAGRVVYRGAPVAGAAVRLELRAGMRRAVPGEELTTGADGRFDFGPAAATEYVVSASAAGRGPAGAYLDLRDPTLAPPPDRIELVLTDCDHVIHGHVHDAGGPIAGASVRVAAAGAIALSSTDDAGAYELCVGAGRATLAASADGYGRVVARTDGGRRVVRDFELAPEVVLTGVVVGSGDAPVAGALVEASLTEMVPFGPDPVAAVADQEGRFAITGVLPGRYAVGARDAGATAEPVEVVARVGEAAEDLVLRLRPAVVVRGRVLEGDVPVAGARVEPRQREVGFPLPRGVDAVTQSDGGFVLDGVAAGPLALRVAGYEVVEPTKVVVSLPESEVTVKVIAKARIRGIVTRGGEPVAGATVDAGRDSPRGGWGGSARSGADGRFEIEGLEPGTYQIGAQNETAFARRVPITVAKGQKLDGVTIEIDLAGQIAGTVVDQRGAPVGGVFVQFRLGEGIDWGMATTSEDGSYVAGAMSGGGDYTVAVRPSSASSVPFSPAPGTTWPAVRLADGNSRASDVRIAIQLDRLQISGMVRHEGGGPAADVRVVAMPQTGPEYMTRWDVPSAASTTGPDGGFALRDLIAGAYVVRARTGTGLEMEVKDVAAGASGVAITLPGLGAIDGELAGFGDAVEVAAVGTGLASSGFSRYRARVERNRFTIRDLPPGRYGVSARAGDAVDLVEVDVAAGKTAAVKLASKGTATVAGRAIDLVTRAPLTDLECMGSLEWMGRSDSVATDGDGRFRLTIPAQRKVQVVCSGGTADVPMWGTVEVELAPGATGEVVLEIVVPKRAAAARLPDIGLLLGGSRPATVVEVMPGRPADRAGVKVGDVVVRVDGVAVASFEPMQVSRLMIDHAIGERAKVVLERAGREVSAEIEIAERSVEE